MHLTLLRLAIRKTAPVERRRERRETRSIPVEICGFNTRGQFFTEQTSTLDISESGCRFRIRAKLEKDSTVSIRMVRQTNSSIPADVPVLLRVAWTKRNHHGWVAGGEKLLPIRLWQGCVSAVTDESRDRSQQPNTGKPQSTA